MKPVSCILLLLISRAFSYIPYKVPSHSRLHPALFSTKTSTATDSTVETLSSVSETFGGVLDGAEWATVAPNSRCSAARLSICTGENEQGERVVAFQVAQNDSKNTQVYKESIAVIPSSLKISNAAAARTLQHAWASVHAVLPHEQGIGGDPNASFAGAWKVVVLGSGNHALQAARALEALDCQVVVVSTQAASKTLASLNRQKKSKSGTSYVQALEAKTVDFAESVKNFDALLDTVGNEFEKGGFSSRVLELLESRHGCHVYRSTYTRQQAIIGGSGLLFGPNEAKDYSQSLLNSAGRDGTMEDCPPPPPRLGRTVERLFQTGVSWPEHSDVVRGWSLGEYWESTTWPRSVEQPSLRFGFPTFDEDAAMEQEEAEDDEPIITGNLARQQALAEYFQQQQRASDESKNSPDIMFVTGVRGLKERILQPELDCVLFLSAPFCRTCRYLQPRFQRMARENSNKDQTESTIVFAKADATGEIGKELGRYLGVDAVPTFVLFRKGERYGKPLSISRLPSSQLERALQYLRDGLEWDTDIMGDSPGRKGSGAIGADEDDEENRPRTRIL